MTDKMEVPAGWIKGYDGALFQRMGDAVVARVRPVTGGYRIETQGSDSVLMPSSPHADFNQACRASLLLCHSVLVDAILESAEALDQAGVSYPDLTKRLWDGYPEK